MITSLILETETADTKITLENDGKLLRISDVHDEDYEYRFTQKELEVLLPFFQNFVQNGILLPLPPSPMLPPVPDPRTDGLALEREVDDPNRGWNPIVITQNNKPSDVATEKP